MGKYIPDLNAATRQELERIPGIDEDVADAIIRYRDGADGIRSFEELMNAQGITQNHIDRLRAWGRIGENVHGRDGLGASG